MTTALGRLRRRSHPRGGDRPGPVSGSPVSLVSGSPTSCVSGSPTSCVEVTITWAPAADTPPRPPRGMSRAARIAAPAVAAVLVAATAIAVTVLGRGGLPPGPSPQPHLTPVPNPPPNPLPPALAIDVVAAGCEIFVVKNVSDYVVLQADDKPVPMGATLLFNEVPLYVQISNPACAYVYVHGHRTHPGPAGSSWNFAVSR
jgi:hypothetical protein